MKILIVENGYVDLIKSRVPLGNYFKSKGYNVMYACPKPPADSDIFDIDIDRSRLSILKLLLGIIKLVKIEKNAKIDTVLSFRLTSNIFNYFSSFFGKQKNRVAVITGLGYSFVYKTLKYSVLKYFISSFYKLAERRLSIITQNPDDLTDLGLKYGKVILGSGISEINNKEMLILQKKKSSFLNLLFVGRLLKSKGVKTAIKLFKKIHKYDNRIKLTIAGDIDDENPDSISSEFLSKIKNLPGVDFLSYVEDMEKVYQDCDILLFPSTYREGVPRTIIEALSFGLTIITTDSPGCKETVNDNGILTNKDDFILDAFHYINSLDKKQIIYNRKQSLIIFREKFSDKVIYPQYLEVIDLSI